MYITLSHCPLPPPKKGKKKIKGKNNNKKVVKNLCPQPHIAYFSHFSLTSIYCGYPDVLHDHPRG